MLASAGGSTDEVEFSVGEYKVHHFGHLFGTFKELILHHGEYVSEIA